MLLAMDSTIKASHLRFHVQDSPTFLLLKTQEKNLNYQYSQKM